MNLEQMEAVARAATPGPWTLWGKADPSQTIAAQGRLMAQTVGGHDEANAAHIATFDPPTVLKLIAVAKAAQQYVEAESHANWQERAALSKALKALAAESSL